MRGRSLVALGHAVLVSVPSVWLVFFTDSYSKYVCRMRVHIYLVRERERARLLPFTHSNGMSEMRCSTRRGSAS